MAVWVALVAATFGISCKGAETPMKVVVLGFDGASWDTIEPLIQAGKLPFLERLRRESAWGPLETFKPTKSPVIWTSIATGMAMEKHGILDFVYLKENDLPVPFDNSERREPSVWQILDHFGRRSVVVNWFVTYPPDRIDGIMVSNRFRRALLLGPERRSRMRDSVHPQELFDRLLPMLELDYDSVREERGLPELGEVYRGLHQNDPLDEVPVLKDFGVYVLQEALIENVALDLYQTEEFDFFAAYFRLPDIVQHVALRLIEPGRVEETLTAMAEGRLSAEERARFQEEISAVLFPFYRYMERILESFVTAEQSENTHFIVLSDHGFTLHPGGYDHYHIPESAPPPPGIFLMRGPLARPGRTEAMNVHDITPTLLHLFDLPAGSTMDGRAATELLDLHREVRFERYSREIMKSAAPGGPDRPERDEELEQEIREKTLRELRSLGYIP
jgi:predicted AlkP superfamily phosphohydrolase/phosphomutase